MLIHYPAILTELPGDTGLLLPENNPVGSLEEGGFPVTFPWGSLRWTELNRCLESQVSWDGAGWTRKQPPPLPSPASLRIIVTRASQPGRGSRVYKCSDLSTSRKSACARNTLCPPVHSQDFPRVQETVLCCDRSNLGRMPLATLTQHHQVCKFSALYLLRRDGAGCLGTFSSVCCVSKRQEATLTWRQDAPQP